MSVTSTLTITLFLPYFSEDSDNVSAHKIQKKKLSHIATIRFFKETSSRNIFTHSLGCFHFCTRELRRRFAHNWHVEYIMRFKVGRFVHTTANNGPAEELYQIFIVEISETSANIFLPNSRGYTPNRGPRNEIFWFCLIIVRVSGCQTVPPICLCSAVKFLHDKFCI